MKSLEIKRIAAGSVFKFNFIVGAIFGLLTSIILLLTGMTLKNIGLELGTFSGGGTLQIGAAIVGIIIGSMAYGLFAGVAGAVGAFIYNIFAAAVGGIVVKVADSE